MKNKNTSILKGLISDKKKVVIVPHTSPDGDAIGSSLALMHLLKNMGHTVNVLSPNQPPYFLKWSPGFEEIIYYEFDEEKCSQKSTKQNNILVLNYEFDFYICSFFL